MTPPIPRAIELVREDLDPRIKARLKQVLLEAGNDPSAEGALREYQRTSKFEILDEKTLKYLDDARQIIKIVRKGTE